MNINPKPNSNTIQPKNEALIPTFNEKISSAANSAIQYVQTHKAQCATAVAIAALAFLSLHTKSSALTNFKELGNDRCNNFIDRYNHIIGNLMNTNLKYITDKPFPIDNITNEFNETVNIYRSEKHLFPLLLTHNCSKLYHNQKHLLLNHPYTSNEPYFILRELTATALAAASTLKFEVWEEAMKAMLNLKIDTTDPFYPGFNVGISADISSSQATLLRLLEKENSDKEAINSFLEKITNSTVYKEYLKREANSAKKIIDGITGSYKDKLQQVKESVELQNQVVQNATQIANEIETLRTKGTEINDIKEKIDRKLYLPQYETKKQSLKDEIIAYGGIIADELKNKNVSSQFYSSLDDFIYTKMYIRYFYKDNVYSWHPMDVVKELKQDPNYAKYSPYDEFVKLKAKTSVDG